MHAELTIREQYVDYLAFAKTVGWTPALDFSEWFWQRDHDPDEPMMSEAEWGALVAEFGTGTEESE